MIAYFDDRGVYVEAEELPAPYTIVVRGEEEIFTPTAIPCRPDESYYWDGTEWQKHIAPVPTQITKLQAYTAMATLGYTEAFDTFMAQNPTAKIAWDLASMVERSNPLVSALASALGLSDADIDTVFITADAGVV